MASDKDATNMQDVDLDDIEVVILVIAKSANKISSAANFLSRRGWPTTVISNLSQAIEFSSENKPDFVLVSINHPSPAISKFSDLLSTTFGTTCIAFAENLDNTSAFRLSQNLLPLKIQGQASGPNLHRGLRKILAEKLNIQLDDRGQSQERANSADRSVPVKPSNAADGQVIIQKNEPGLTQNKGPTMIKGEDLDLSSPNRFGSESISTGKYTMTKKNRRSLKDFSRNPLDKPGDVVMGESAAVAEKLKKSLFGDSPGAENSDSKFDDDDDDDDATANELTAADDKFDGHGSITTRRSAMGKHGQTSNQNDRDGSTSNGQQFNKNAKGSSHNQSGGHTGAIGHPGYKVDSGTEKCAKEVRAEDETSPGNSASSNEVEKKSIAKKSLSSVGPHSIIERAVQEAIREIVRPCEVGCASIEMIEQVGVLPIDSPTLPGYLVLAWPHEEKSAIEPFFKQAQLIIGSTFKKMGVRAHLEPGFFVTLPKVDFANWAQESASFFFSTAHGNEEIGVAFFATQKPIAKPKQGEDKNMYSINLDNISTEQPVNFKVYLHMKKNKKYFLYLRNGRQLLPEQKERLEGRQVKDLYMKTIDVENLRMFLASCHLRKKIKKAG